MMALSQGPFAQLLEQYDLIYDVAPEAWNTGIPLANGQIGALIWGDGAPLKVTLDKYDCWELREQQPDPAIFNYANLRALVEGRAEEEAAWEFRDRWRQPRALHPSRLPMPRLELDFGQAPASFEARLRLYEAVAEGSMEFEEGGAQWRAYVHARRNLIVMELAYEGEAERAEVKVRTDHLSEEARATLEAWGYEEAEQGTEGCLTPRPPLPRGCSAASWERGSNGTTPRPSPCSAASCERGSNGEAVAGPEVHWLRQRFPGGGEYVVAWHRIEPEPGREVLLVSILSHRDAEEPVQEACRLLAEAADDHEGLFEEHAAWWRAYWPASYLSIPDAQLENLYYVEMYKLGCLSRPEGLPISLQGLWSPDGEMPPWSGDYHLDSNVQESYWPIYTANRLELGECLYETFFACLPRWREQCERFFGFEGAWSGCAMAYDGARIYGYHGVEFWPGNAAWLAHHYWLHWLYSQDRQFLRDRAYPMMRACLQTYQGLLEPGEDGRLHIPLGYSPEWGEGSTERYGPDPNCDLALIRWLAEALLAAAATLDMEEPKAQGWRELLEGLVDYAQGEDGLHVTAGQPLIHSHRHHSHLMAIHPLGVLNIEQDDEARALIGRSLAHLIRQGMGQWAGHGLPPASLIASRAGMGNMGWQICRLYADAFITPNTFHVNGDYRGFGLYHARNTPMTLEAGFGFAAALMEMLLQSWGGVIRLFPSMPDRWSEAYFEDLRAEGAFLVTSRLREGRAVFVSITSEAGGTCRLRNPWPGGTVKVVGPEAENTLEGDTLAWETEAGGRYLVYAGADRPAEDDLAPMLMERTEQERHWFGLQRQARF